MSTSQSWALGTPAAVTASLGSASDRPGLRGGFGLLDLRFPPPEGLTPNKGMTMPRCPHCNVQQFVNPNADPALEAMANLCWKCVKPLDTEREA